MPYMAVFACCDAISFGPQVGALLASLKEVTDRIGVRPNAADFYTTAQLEAYQAEPTILRLQPDLGYSDLAFLSELSLDSLDLYAASRRGESVTYDFRAQFTRPAVFMECGCLFVIWPTWRTKDLTQTELAILCQGLFDSWNQIGTIDYGFARAFDWDYGEEVMIFLNGVYTSYQSFELAVDLATWQRGSKQRKEKLRSLYWGNFLGPGHIRRLRACQDDAIQVLERALGSRYSPIGDGAFFSIGSPDGGDATIEGQIRRLFTQCELLMEPDDETRKFVRSLLTQRHRPGQKDISADVG